MYKKHILHSMMFIFGVWQQSARASNFDKALATVRSNPLAQAGIAFTGVIAVHNAGYRQGAEHGSYLAVDSSDYTAGSPWNLGSVLPTSELKDQKDGKQNTSISTPLSLIAKRSKKVSTSKQRLRKIAYPLAGYQRKSFKDLAQDIDWSLSHGGFIGDESLAHAVFVKAALEGSPRLFDALQGKRPEGKKTATALSGSSASSLIASSSSSSSSSSFSSSSSSLSSASPLPAGAASISGSNDGLAPDDLELALQTFGFGCYSSTANDEMSQLRSENQLCRQRAAEHNEAITSLQSEHFAHVGRLQLERDTLRRENLKKDGDLDLAQKKTANLQVHLNRLEEDYKTRDANLGSRLDTLYARYNQLSSDNRELYDQVDTLQHEKLMLHTDCAANTTELASVNYQNFDLRQSVGRMKGQIDSLAHQVKQLTAPGDRKSDQKRSKTAASSRSPEPDLSFEQNFGTEPAEAADSFFVESEAQERVSPSLSASGGISSAPMMTSHSDSMSLSSSLSAASASTVASLASVSTSTTAAVSPQNAHNTVVFGMNTIYSPITDEQEAGSPFTDKNHKVD